MSTKFTPEPWRAECLDEKHIWIMDRRGRYLAEIVAYDEEGSFIKDPEQRMANAEIMASAPAMYAALKAFRDEVCNRSQYNFWKKLVDDADKALGLEEK